MMGGWSARAGGSRAPRPVVLMARASGVWAKTTATAKLARYLPQEHSSSVDSRRCDVYRRQPPSSSSSRSGGAGGADVYHQGRRPRQDPVEIAAWALSSALVRTQRKVLDVD